MKKLQHVKNAIFGQPWAITEEYLNTICDIYRRHLFDAQNEKLEGISAQIPAQGEIADVPFEIIDGIAILNLVGPLFSKANLMTKLSGATSLEEFRSLFDLALMDSDVSGIMIKCDSPGGSVLGLHETATKVFEARMQSKPIIAFAEGMCASAAYMICSQAEEFFCTEGSILGSIGVILRMDNFDRAERNEGNDPIIIRSGELKAIGEGAITPNQQQSLSNLVMKFFDMFKETISRGRPGLNIDQVATGEIWIGTDAIKLGLADDIQTFERIITTFGNRIPAK